MKRFNIFMQVREIYFSVKYNKLLVQKFLFLGQVQETFSGKYKKFFLFRKVFNLSKCKKLLLWVENWLFRTF